MVNLIFEAMAIHADSPNQDNSPWYKIMEEKGENWNSFAKEIGAEIEGSYNSDLLTFNMSIEIHGIEVRFDGRRDLKSRINLLIPRDGVIVEQLQIQFKNEGCKIENHFLIKRKRLLHLPLSIFRRYSFCRTIGNYRIYYNSKSYLDQLLNFQILGFNNLWKIKSSDKNFELVLSYLPSESKSLMTMLNFCIRIIMNK